MGRLLFRLWHDRGGVVAVEFAIILPVMLIMFFGTFEVSMLLRAYLAANRSAQLFANLVAQDTKNGFSSSDSTDFCVATKLAVAPFSGTSLKATVASITRNSSGTIGFDWQDTTCGGGAGSFTDATVASNGLLTTNGDTVIAVKVQYSYSATIHFVLPASYTIVQTAYQRPRTNGVIPHT